MSRFDHFRKSLYKVTLLLVAALILSASEIDDHKKKLQDIENEINKNKKYIEEASKRENITLLDIEKIDEKLNSSEREKQKNERELSSLSASMRILEKKIEALENSFRGNAGNVKKAIIKYLATRRSKNNLLALLSSEDAKYSLFRYGIFNKLNKKNEEFIRGILTEKENLGKRQSEYLIRMNQAEKVSTLLELNRKKIESEKKLKKTYLEGLKKKKSGYRAYLEKLEKEKKTTSDKIKDLIRQEMARKEQKKTDKSELPALLKRYMGTITFPLPGQIVTKFGKTRNEEYQITINHDGIEFAAASEDLPSPVGGAVIFAEWIKGKGNVVIINIDENLSVVFANFEEIYVEKGKNIKKNDVIGRISENENGRKVLYMSTWLNGEPVDPELIIKR